MWNVFTIYKGSLFLRHLNYMDTIYSRLFLFGNIWRWKYRGFFHDLFNIPMRLCLMWETFTMTGPLVCASANNTEVTARDFRRTAAGCLNFQKKIRIISARSWKAAKTLNGFRRFPSSQHNQMTHEFMNWRRPKGWDWDHNFGGKFHMSYLYFTHIFCSQWSFSLDFKRIAVSKPGLFNCSLMDPYGF